MRIFLGGTCTSNWRKDYIEFLKSEKLEYYNPVVEEWGIREQEEEERQKILCDKLLWVITPDMRGHYSVFEVATLSLLYPRKLIFVLEMRGEIKQDGSYSVWSAQQMKSWNAIFRTLDKRGVVYFIGILHSHSHLRQIKELLSDV